MEVYCAGCGCLVQQAVRIIPCESDECCCLHLPVADPMTIQATRIRVAFNARDMDAFRDLLAEDARWGDDDAPNKCRSRNDVVATFQRLLAEGVRGEIVQSMVGTRGVVFRLRVEWPEPNAHSEDDFWHAYILSDGLITEIRRYDDADSAVAAVAG